MTFTLNKQVEREHTSVAANVSHFLSSGKEAG